MLCKSPGREGREKKLFSTHTGFHTWSHLPSPFLRDYGIVSYNDSVNMKSHI